MRKDEPMRTVTLQPPIECGRVCLDEVLLCESLVAIRWHFKDGAAREYEEPRDPNDSLDVELRSYARLLRAVMPMRVVDDHGTTLSHRKTGGGTNQLVSNFEPAVAEGARELTVEADGSEVALDLSPSS